MKVLLELCTRFNGSNNGDLSLSLDDAARLLGMGKSTAVRAYKELQLKGFIKKVAQGSWIRGEATTWRITFLNHARLGRTNEWREWAPAEKPKKERRPWSQRKGTALEQFRAAGHQKRFLGSETDRIEAITSPGADLKQ